MSTTGDTMLLTSDTSSVGRGPARPRVDRAKMPRAIILERALVFGGSGRSARFGKRIDRLHGTRTAEAEA